MWMMLLFCFCRRAAAVACVVYFTRSCDGVFSWFFSYFTRTLVERQFLFRCFFAPQEKNSFYFGCISRMHFLVWTFLSSEKRGEKVVIRNSKTSKCFFSIFFLKYLKQREWWSWWIFAVFFKCFLAVPSVIFVIFFRNFFSGWLKRKCRKEKSCDLFFFAIKNLSATFPTNLLTLSFIKNFLVRLFFSQKTCKAKIL